MENTGYLFAAFVIAWLLFFGYLFLLSGRQKKLQREIDSLKELGKVKEILR
jgi:CcmD family protein